MLSFLILYCLLIPLKTVNKINKDTKDTKCLLWCAGLLNPSDSRRRLLAVAPPGGPSSQRPPRPHTRDTPPPHPPPRLHRDFLRSCIIYNIGGPKLLRYLGNFQSFNLTLGLRIRFQKRLAYFRVFPVV